MKESMTQSLREECQVSESHQQESGRTLGLPHPHGSPWWPPEESGFPSADISTFSRFILLN